MTPAELEEEYEALRDDLIDFLAGDGSLAVVKAPPGSGKTSSLIAVLAALVGQGFSVAVAAQTNSQADDICARFARAHPGVATTRFAGTGTRPFDGSPASVPWITHKDELPRVPGVTISTAAKWSLTDIAHTYDLLAVDEAWQMAWADLMQCAILSERFLLIGDPGQIPPVVPVDVRRWETSPRPPHEAAPEVVLSDSSLKDRRLVRSLPACWRLPYEAVGFVRPFYDFEFVAALYPGQRGVDLPRRHRLSPLADGRPLMLTIPTPEQGPPMDVDVEVAEAAATVVRELLNSGARVRAGRDGSRRLNPENIGVSCTHRRMNAELARAIGAASDRIRVDTPERWQGLERPVMIAVHPLSGVTNPSAFDLDTGRLCVMASRQQSALILLTRDHVGATLANYIPSAEQPPGRPDVVGRGHDAHMRFWEALESQTRIRPIS